MDGVVSQKKTLIGRLESPPPPKWHRINSPASHSRVGNVTGWATCAGRGYGSSRAWVQLGNFPPATNPHPQRGLPKPAASFFLSKSSSPLPPSLDSSLTASDHVAMLPLWIIQSHALCTCTPSLELSQVAVTQLPYLTHATRPMRPSKTLSR